MKVLLDAQLPRRLAQRLAAAGHDALHTRDLPRGNRSTDAEIVSVADREGRVVVTKDADFVSSFLVARRPARLMLIATGNISNNELEALLLAQLSGIEAAFRDHAFVELTRHALVIHD